MQFTDTHCHIQVADYPLESADVIKGAKLVGVDRLIVVGCDLYDSQAATGMAATNDGIWAAIGLHPHEASKYVGEPELLNEFAALASQSKVVAIGECGLDYYYNHSPKAAQKQLLRFQLELAQKHNLPLIFHVRDAFQDFWPIFDEYPGLRGVVHSFTAAQADLDQILTRNLYVGINGIMTFTKKPEQLAAAKAIPLDRLLLETDAPYLTPSPLRGKVCEPKYVRVTAEFLSNLRGESLEELAAATTHNAATLFKLNN